MQRWRGCRSGAFLTRNSVTPDDTSDTGFQAHWGECGLALKRKLEVGTGSAVPVPGSRAELVERFVVRHGNELILIARRYSNSAADADDAFQRTIEAMLTKKLPEDADRLLSWAWTVVRNEALMQHRRESKSAVGEFEQITQNLTADVEPMDAKLIGDETVSRGREALLRLKPEQTRCLLLRADGYDYKDICARTGFSYTKVNRLISEGRRALRERFTSIERGETCRRLDGVISMLADGEPLREEARRDVELHLRNCMACKAQLREYRLTPRKVASLMPVGIAITSGPVDQGLVGRATDWLQSVAGSIHERLTGGIAVSHQGAEMAFAKKAVVAGAITASLIGGGAALEATVDHEPSTNTETPVTEVGPSGTPSIGPSGATGGSETGSTAETDSTDERRELKEEDVVKPDSKRPAIEPAPAQPVQPEAGFANDPNDRPPADAGGGDAGDSVGGIAP